MKILEVGLGERAYAIKIASGLLQNLAVELQPFMSRARLVLISDTRVSGLYRDALDAQFKAAQIQAQWIIVPEGESSKSFTQFQAVVEACLALRLERRDLLVAVGGGVVGDLAGYVAASLLRGLDFVQVPTSLLAQVDSSVGGKTGINSKHGKNLVGAFHQPKAVLIDIDVLSTLSDRQLRAGFAEVLKYGLINQPDFFTWLDQNRDALLARDPEALGTAIYRSCKAKAEVVAADEKELGLRALLNLGHTFAHALEAQAGYDGSLLHGEAVGIGMVMAHYLSAELGLMDKSDAERIHAVIAAFGLPTNPAFPANIAPGRAVLRAAMQKDKKVEGGKLTFVLSKGIGHAFKSSDVPAVALDQLLTASGCPE